MIMPTSRECICCCEVEKVVMKKEESASVISCITDHEGFKSVCLNASVLTQFHTDSDTYNNNIIMSVKF